MAVYTQLSLEEIRQQLAPFELGTLVGAEPVAAGIENTTYFLRFEQSEGRVDEYVLTVGESIGKADMEFVARLTTLLQERGVAVPAAVTRKGQSVVWLAGKPAILIPKIEGRPPVRPSVAQCRAVGEALARMHCVMLDTPTLAHESHKSLAWVAHTGSSLLPHLSAHAQASMRSCLNELQQFAITHHQLPQSVIHGDLFRDNTLFIGDRLAAMIDFFSAGTGYLSFDLAVVANDWCVENGHAVPESEGALLEGYNSLRPLTREERQCWGKMLEIAALRFWVSRLADSLLPGTRNTATSVKEPELYRHLMLMRRASNSSVITHP